MSLDMRQTQALELMNSGRNVFLTGKAGSGKTKVIDEFKTVSKKTIAVMAPTGIAALNVGGTTIHSFFQLKTKLLAEEEWTVADQKTVDRIKLAEIIIIDEISMVRSDIFWAMEKRLRECAPENMSKQPFGGKQIIAVGDFFQLPPVVTSKHEENILMRKYGGIYAFQTTAWQDAFFECISLDKVFRQDESVFLQILNSIRCGMVNEPLIKIDGTTLNAVEALNTFQKANPQQSAETVALCMTNKEANQINQEHIKKLNGSQKTYTATTSGTFSSGAQNYIPTDKELRLITDQRVILLNNMSASNGQPGYVNGDTGTIFELHEKSVIVMIRRTNSTVEVAPHKWTEYRYEYERNSESGKMEFKAIEAGSFIQLPLKAGYAITVHKSQGLSLDSVRIHNSDKCFASGQLYTALSRCRSIKNLSLAYPVQPGHVIVSRDVMIFYVRCLFRPEHFLKCLTETAQSENIGSFEAENIEKNTLYPTHETLDFLRKATNLYCKTFLIEEVSCSRGMPPKILRCCNDAFEAALKHKDRKFTSGAEFKNLVNALNKLFSYSEA